MNKRLNTLCAALACLLLPLAAFAQFPATAYGWNLGNTMEANCEGCWAPPATQALINQVSASGFNTIRIPVNWANHMNQQSVIDAAWLARVKVVVDWSLAKNMTVIINMHHDGWFDSCGFRRFDSKLNAKYVKVWQQIAQYFQAYDSRLMFCAANEPWVDSQAKCNILKQYYQSFINTVRGTGGNNANRWLILPGPDTNIDKTYDWFTLPTDPTPGRLAVDVHYYDPYDFTLMTTDESWGSYSFFWGAGYKTTVPSLLVRNCTWGEEDWLAGQIAKMKTKFVNNGVPVMIGEFAAGKRIDYPELGTGVEYNRHLASRTYFDKKVVELCNAAGIKPYFWDNGWSGKDGFNLFDRNTAAVMEQPQITALTGGAAQAPPP
jgi:aryl-phospho-beta-D-glucosidase BglC (GH1 family)